MAKEAIPISSTVCKQRPECCTPRKIEMVLLDADDTMWEIKPYGIASGIKGPLKKIDDDTVEATEGEYYPYEPAKPTPKPKVPPPYPVYLKSVPEVGPLHLHEEELEDWWKSKITPQEQSKEEKAELKAITEELLESLPEKDKRFLKAATEVTGKQIKLFKFGKPEVPAPPPKPKAKPKYEPRKITIKLLPTLRDTLNKLQEKGIKMGVISLNTPGSVKRIIDAFGLSDKFVEVQDTWENKGKKFDEITKRHKVCPCNALFVDNMVSHVEDVANKCGLGLVIGKGKDIEVPIEILNYIEERYAKTSA